MGCAQAEPVQVSTQTPTQLPHTAAPTDLPPATATPVATLRPPNTPTPASTSVPVATDVPTTAPTATDLPPTNTPNPDYEIEIAAVGDIMLDRRLGDALINGDLDYPFELMRPWLEPADVTVGNFESALGDLGQPAEGKSFPFQSPPQAAEALALAGFDVVSLANNHALDYGPESLLDGINLLQSAGVAPVGAGRNAIEARSPLILEVDGVKLAFLAYMDVLSEDQGYDMTAWEATDERPGVAWGRPEEVAADIAAVAPQVDHVIVLLHFGIEYLPPITPEQQALGRAAIDAGASVVLGHHTHILQKIEEYNGGLIAYGLGNFAFDIDGDPSTIVLRAWLKQEGVSRFELVPAVIDPGGRPRPATADEAQAILDQIGR